MKLKNLINLLKTDYLEISNIHDPYSINYTKKKEIQPDILEANVVEIDPVGTLRKTLFEPDAENSDFVAAIKIVYTFDDVEERPQEEYSETIETEEFKTEKEEKKEPNFGGNPFGNMPPFLDPEFINKLITPDMLDQITQSDDFKKLFTPESINEIIHSKEFQDFINNPDFGNFSASFGPFNVKARKTDSNYDDNEEYEEDYEIDETDYTDDDDDEYEEI